MRVEQSRVRTVAPGDLHPIADLLQRDLTAGGGHD